MRSRTAIVVLAVAVLTGAIAVAVWGNTDVVEAVALALLAATLLTQVDVRLALRRVGRTVSSHRDASRSIAEQAASTDGRIDAVTADLQELRTEVASLPAVLQPRLTELQQLLVDAAVEQSALGDQLDRRLERLRDDLTALPRLAGNVERLHERLPGLRESLIEQLAVESRQVEALLALHALFDIEAPPPFSRGWAAHGDLLLEAVRVVLAERPTTILECGSGTSSVWLGYACHRLGPGHRVVSLEHDPHFAAHTRDVISQHGLAEQVDIRLAPLQPYDVLGKEMLWYSLEAVADVDQVELLIVDGPPKGIQEKARLPAVPLLRDRLRARSLVLLDDAKRHDEAETVRLWHESIPGSELDIDREFARGLGSLRLP